MEIRLIPYGSTDYMQMVDLRVEALLQPIGIPASYIEPEKEKHDSFIGAFEGSRIIGCCILTATEEKTLQLRQMAVRPGYQGRGIGAAILRFAEDVARKKGASLLMMHARDPVIGFYQSCGYVIAGEPFLEVGMGHHRMQKEL